LLRATTQKFKTFLGNREGFFCAYFPACRRQGIPSKGLMDFFYHRKTGNMPNSSAIRKYIRSQHLQQYSIPQNLQIFLSSSYQKIIPKIRSPDLS